MPTQSLAFPRELIAMTEIARAGFTVGQAFRLVEMEVNSDGTGRTEAGKDLANGIIQAAPAVYHGSGGVPGGRLAGPVCR